MPYRAPTPNAPTIRLRLRELRQHSPWSTHALALAMGRTQNWLMKLEAGDFLPTIDQLILLGRLLGCKHWWDLVEIGEFPPLPTPEEARAEVRVRRKRHWAETHKAAALVTRGIQPLKEEKRG